MHQDPGTTFNCVVSLTLTSILNSGRSTQSSEHFEIQGRCSPCMLFLSRRRRCRKLQQQTTESNKKENSRLYVILWGRMHVVRSCRVSIVDWIQTAGSNISRIVSAELDVSPALDSKFQNRYRRILANQKVWPQHWPQHCSSPRRSVDRHTRPLPSTCNLDLS